MAIAHVQDSSQVASTGGPQVAILTFSNPITAGNAIVLCVSQNVGAVRSYFVNDNKGSGWVVAARFTSTTNRWLEIWHRANCPAGSITITVTHYNSSPSFNCSAAEFSGFGNVISIDTSGGRNTVGVNHNSTASGLTSANPCLGIVSANVETAAAVALVPDVTYTRLPAASTNVNHLYMWKLFPLGATAEVGAWQSTNASRTGNSLLTLLSGTNLPGVNPIGTLSGLNPFRTTVTLDPVTTTITFDAPIVGAITD